MSGLPLSEEEDRALYFYSTDAGNFDINRYMNGKREDLYNTEKEILRNIGIIRRIFDKKPQSNRAFTVFRGDNNTKGSRLNVGDVVTFWENMFVSTSTDPWVALKFVPWKTGPHCCFYRIELPKGSVAVPIDNSSAYTKEREILLPPGMVFKVVGKRYEDPRGPVDLVLVYDLEPINKTSTKPTELITDVDIQLITEKLEKMKLTFQNNHCIRNY